MSLNPNTINQSFPLVDLSCSVCDSVSPQLLSLSQCHAITNRYSGSMVECPLCDREVAGSIPGRVIPKTLKMVLAALSLGAQH